MPRLLSAALAREKNLLASDHVMSMLFEVTIAGAPGPLRLANYDQDIVFHGLPFLRFPVDVDLLEEASAASLVHLRLTAANVDQQIQSLLESYWRQDPDWTVVIWMIDCAQPDQTDRGAGEVFAVQSVTTDLVTCVFDVVAEGLTLTKTVPGRRFTTSGGFPSVPRRG